MLGILQGRLSYAGKKLNHFPKNPFKEFKLASKIGYDFIELFGEREKNDQNPIWSNSGIKKYKKVSKENGLEIFSFCDNYIINHSLSSTRTFKVITNTIEKLSNLKIKKYILPLYGRSEINSKNKLKIYRNLSIISNLCSENNMELIFESNMSVSEFKRLKKNINSKNCFFLFDTGNRILLKKSLVDDIYNFKNNIRHIHLKDKNRYNKNVILGEGMVKFEPIFAALKKIKYKGSFTIESQRGKNIEQQATKNYNFFKELINRYLYK